jgi:tetratricopeptide (TPR) repeat protein
VQSAPIRILSIGFLLVTVSWVAATPAEAAGHTASAFYRKGVEAHRESRRDEAIRLFRRALEKDPEQAASLLELGNVLEGKGWRYEALRNYTRALAIYRERGVERGKAGALNNIGEIHKSHGRYARAMKFHEKSLAIKKQLGDRLGIAGTRLNMGIVAYRKGSLDLAIRYMEEAMEIFRSRGSPRAKAAENNHRIFRRR